MAKWIVYTSAAFTWTAEWLFLLRAETPAQWFIVSGLIIITPFIMIPMVEEAEDLA